MNKKLALLILASSGALALTSAFLGASSSKGLWLFSDSEPGGSIVLDASNPDCPFAAGEFNASSALGNAFTFYNQNMVLDHGLFTIEDGGYLVNSTPLNGLYRVEVSLASAKTLHYSYSANGQGAVYETKEVAAGLNVITFDSFDPSSLRLYAEGESISFSKLALYYSCLADSTNAITEAHVIEFGGLDIGYNGIIAKTGTRLSEIDASAFKFYAPKAGELQGDEVENLFFAYEKRGEDKVVDGRFMASVSFSYQGEAYFSPGFIFAGYSSYEYQIEELSLGQARIHKQSSDALPEGLTLDVNGSFFLLDNNGGKVIDLTSYESVDLTSDMVTSFDEQPFTKVGQHMLTVQYQGASFDCEYFVYDPDANNIRDLYCIDEDLSVPVGTSSEEFIAYVSTKRFGIAYYDADPSLPKTTYLSGENFILTGNEFDGTYLDLNIPVTYQGYQGQVPVHVEKEKGNLLGEYLNDDGVEMPNRTIYRIALYENGVAIVYSEKTLDAPSQEVAYTLEGTKLTLREYGLSFVYSINEESHTFGNYIPVATLLYTLATDFTALGAPEEDYLGNLYNDGTIVFEIDENNFVCSFTYDSVDPNVIYFNFIGNDCKGTIDYSSLRMVVTRLE